MSRGFFRAAEYCLTLTERRAYPILDHKRRVVGVMCSPPDAAYFTACDTSCNAISEEGRRAYFSQAERKHRRGKYPALNFGVLHGKGTRGPVNLKNEPHDGMILRLRERNDIIQLACFGSGEHSLLAIKLD